MLMYGNSLADAHRWGKAHSATAAMRSLTDGIGAVKRASISARRVFFMFASTFRSLAFVARPERRYQLAALRHWFSLLSASSSLHLLDLIHAPGLAFLK
jgi:hypothetical protein